MNDDRDGEGEERHIRLDGENTPGARIAPYPKGYIFPMTDAASAYTMVSTKVLQVLPQYGISRLAHAVFLTALAEPGATAGPEGDCHSCQGLAKLDPEDLASRLGAETDEITAAVQELADRSLLLSPERPDDNLWQVNPTAAFRGPSAEQHKVINRLIEQRGGEFPVLPEPGTVLVSAVTGKTFTA
ncbi:hypothetical protein [Streptomyces sp. NRRL S-350]|uniref:hypothetical protein n=1 Tax=Streptomyces sp. NRRL S-350 TaxID=1463902 RepID=UPI0004BF88E4|nr:hypothetical protein [Streptomyces sp. NRRL S-350]